jgi:hypothetical protein
VNADPAPAPAAASAPASADRSEPYGGQDSRGEQTAPRTGDPGTASAEVPTSDATIEAVPPEGYQPL